MRFPKAACRQNASLPGWDFIRHLANSPHRDPGTAQGLSGLEGVTLNAPRLADPAGPSCRCLQGVHTECAAGSSPWPHTTPCRATQCRSV